MKDRKRLLELAERHGIKTTKRLFTEDVALRKTVFLDVPKPIGQIEEELRERGVLRDS